MPRRLGLMRSRPQFVMTEQEQRQPSLRTVNVYDVACAVRRFFHPVIEHNLIALPAAQRAFSEAFFEVVCWEEKNDDARVEDV